MNLQTNFVKPKINNNKPKPENFQKMNEHLITMKGGLAS